MAFCLSSQLLSWMPSGHFFLPLTGLKPGTYYYKFIVDGEALHGREGTYNPASASS